MSRIKDFLSGRMANVLFTLIAVIAINSMQQVNYNFGYDNSYSLAAAKNLSEGHGYSIAMASTEDLSKVRYESLNKWPPGYSLLLVMVHAVSGADWILSAYILNAIGLTLLVLVFRVMLIQLVFPSWIINLAVFYFGFIYHSFLTFFFSDIFGVLFFMTGCSLLVQGIKKNKNSVYPVLFAAICFSFSAYMKYLYVGCALVPFLFLIYYGFTLKKKKIVSAAIAGLGIVIVFIGILILFQYEHSGQSVYIKPTAKGFYPEQLLMLGPVIPGSFMNVDFITWQFALITKLPYSFWNVIIRLLNAGCLIWLGYICLNLVRKKFFLRDSYRAFYAGLCLSAGVYISLFLGLLTLRYFKKYDAIFPSWVYLQEVRYYAPLCIMILQFGIWLFFYPSIFMGKTLTLIFRILLTFVVIQEITHSAYFIIRHTLVLKEYGISRPSEQKYMEAYNLTRQEVAKTGRVVVCSFADISNIAGLNGSSSIFNFSQIQEPMFSSQPCTLLTIVDERNNNIVFPYLSRMKTRLIYKRYDLYYYATDISMAVHP